MRSKEKGIWPIFRKLRGTEEDWMGGREDGRHCDLKDGEDGV